MDPVSRFLQSRRPVSWIVPVSRTLSLEATFTNPEHRRVPVAAGAGEVSGPHPPLPKPVRAASGPRREPHAGPRPGPGCPPLLQVRFYWTRPHPLSYVFAVAAFEPQRQSEFVGAPTHGDASQSPSGLLKPRVVLTALHCFPPSICT